MIHVWPIINPTKVQHFFLAASNPGAAFQIIWDNLRYLASFIDSMILRLHIVPELRIVICPLTLWPRLSIMRRQTIFFNGLLLFYTGLALSWPSHPARYSIPLVPILLLSLFQGVQAATTFVRAHRRMPWAAIIVPVVVRIPIAIVVLLRIGWLWGYVHVDRNKYLALWERISDIVWLEWLH
jgi:hypothetical protein